MTNEALFDSSLFLSQRPTLRAYLSLANLFGIAFFRRFDVSRGCTCQVNRTEQLGDDCLSVISSVHEGEYDTGGSNSC